MYTIIFSFHRNSSKSGLNDRITLRSKHAPTSLSLLTLLSCRQSVRFHSDQTLLSWFKRAFAHGSPVESNSLFFGTQSRMNRKIYQNTLFHIQYQTKLTWFDEFCCCCCGKKTKKCLQHWHWYYGWDVNGITRIFQSIIVLKKFFFSKKCFLLCGCYITITILNYWKK